MIINAYLEYANIKEPSHSAHLVGPCDSFPARQASGDIRSLRSVRRIRREAPRIISGADHDLIFWYLIQIAPKKRMGGRVERP